MKKKILALMLSFGLALGVAQPITVHAADTAEETQGIASAEEKTFDTEYSITWEKDDKKCWSKLVIPEQGILEFKATKLDSDELGLISYKVKIYDENEKCILYDMDWEDSKEAKCGIGLEEGTYYVSFDPEYTYYHKGQTIDYKFTFTPTVYCEIERNNSKEAASPMKVDHTYTGWINYVSGSTSEYQDKEDVYEVTLKKGQVYKFSYKTDEKSFGKYRAALYGKNMKFGSFGFASKADQFQVYGEDVFVAPYSGVYYAQIGSEASRYKYEVGVINVTPKKPALKSVKATGKNATVTWSKTRGTDYQMQYSLNKNFKNAKTVDVSGNLNSAKIKRLASNKKYYVRVRSYAKHETGCKYSAWSNVKTVKTK